MKLKCMSFLIKDDELLNKCSKNWKKISSSIIKEFDIEPVYNKYLINASLYNCKTLKDVLFISNTD